MATPATCSLAVAYISKSKLCGKAVAGYLGKSMTPEWLPVSVAPRVGQGAPGTTCFQDAFKALKPPLNLLRPRWDNCVSDAPHTWPSKCAIWSVLLLSHIPKVHSPGSATGPGWAASPMSNMWTKANNQTQRANQNRLANLGGTLRCRPPWPTKFQVQSVTNPSQGGCTLRTLTCRLSCRTNKKRQRDWLQDTQSTRSWLPSTSKDLQKTLPNLG